MSIIYAILGIYVFTMLTTMTILFFKRDAELDRVLDELIETRRERDSLKMKLALSEATSDAIWSALMAHDDSEEEVKFGEF